jgi:hypothetical protein
MSTATRLPFTTTLALLSIVLTGTTYAGPPFLTDDPEPVELHHLEFYLSATQTRSGGGRSGASPILEMNYGALPDLQLHLLAPFTYEKTPGETAHYGYGDTEVGFKYRFLHETDSLPQIGIFPLVEIPTGNEERGLGSGNTQLFIPVWLQKSFGDWTTYGGGGYWFHPGTDNRDYWYAGWEVQRKITESLTLGGEVQFHTADTVAADAVWALNAGGIWDLSERYHVIFSAGHSITGPGEFQSYLGLQITLGPDK